MIEEVITVVIWSIGAMVCLTAGLLLGALVLDMAGKRFWRKMRDVYGLIRIQRVLRREAGAARDE